MKGYKSNFSILFWLVFGVWVSHYEMLMQEFQETVNVRHKGILCLYQNISSLCAREFCNEKLQELCSKMKSVVLNTSVFAGSISFFMRDMNAGFASRLTSHILFTSDWDLHNELLPHTAVCVCSPVCFSGSKKHSQCDLWSGDQL